MVSAEQLLPPFIIFVGQLLIALFELLQILGDMELKAFYPVLQFLLVEIPALCVHSFEFCSVNSNELSSNQIKTLAESANTRLSCQRGPMRFKINQKVWDTGMSFETFVNSLGP